VTYLDSAASSLVPRSVIEAVNEYYEKSGVNIHRGVYKASAWATDIYEATRKEVSDFIDAKNCDIIYTRNATEGLNLVAASLSQVDKELSDFNGYSAWKTGFQSGDVILISESEHHANIVPWMMLQRKFNLEIFYIPVLDNGVLDFQSFLHLKSVLRNKTVKIVSLAHVSNVTGVYHDLSVYEAYAREKGAIFVVDAAQSVCHERISQTGLNADFLVFSAHKMLGPSGIGILCGKKELLTVLPPYQTGGDMIEVVAKDRLTFQTSPQRFEAGTPHIAGVFGLSEAVKILQNFEQSDMEKNEEELTLLLLERLSREKGIKIQGPVYEDVRDKKIKKAGLVSFTLNGVHPHDVGTIFDSKDVAIRVGHHCCQILMKVFQVPATCRASLYMYNDENDIENFFKALHEVKSVFGL